ncbi:hypothetical protein I7I52_04400 [Histoplasma capsulatum]|uniref:Uncharacterized protein n=1 Tax=Ajellomyces capsulatus TaxID=5037 RepID=A0A8H7YPA4_AJECA|nr:hypothetical protein I7I52_04400 [Histoplasma capsulatum]
MNPAYIVLLSSPFVFPPSHPDPSSFLFVVIDSIHTFQQQSQGFQPPPPPPFARGS